MNILIINGPNLNMLGKRDKIQYGSMTLAELQCGIEEFVADNLKDISLDFEQSNFEGQLIEWIQTASVKYDAIVLNAGAYTHYSYAIRDAIECCGIPVYEVHLSDIHKREQFRHISVLEDVCVMQISGLGMGSYTKAIEEIVGRYNDEKS